MAQTGDPTGTGTGGSKEPDLRRSSPRRISPAARSAWRAPAIPTAPTRQFFIMFADGGFLDGQYTVCGQGARAAWSASTRSTRASRRPSPTRSSRMKVMKDMQVGGTDGRHDLENTLYIDLHEGPRRRSSCGPISRPATWRASRSWRARASMTASPFHRVIEGFMAQGGDPTGTGTGGSKKPNLKAEFSREPHVRGVCSMARVNRSRTRPTASSSSASATRGSSTASTPSGAR